MELDIYVVDAFTDQQFKGNSAAVVPISEWLSEDLMQNIAIENNLSETAFIKPLSRNHFEIRWFSPITEIDFCGHATLAASYVLFNHLGVKETIEYSTKQVGNLFVSQSDERQIVMSFPNQAPVPVVQIPEALQSGLSIQPLTVLKNRQAFFAVYDNEADVLNVSYDADKLKTLAPLDVVVTAKKGPQLNSSETTQGNDYDFVSRYFWPANGGEEDPVTGSIHSGLAPYWAERLDKTELLAFQASKRGGYLHCAIKQDRIQISGTGKLYLKGKIFV